MLSAADFARKSANRLRRYSIFLNELIEREKVDPLGKNPRPALSPKVPTYQFVNTDVFERKVANARSYRPILQALQQEGVVNHQYQVVKLRPLVRLLSREAPQKAFMTKHKIHPQAFRAFVAKLNGDGDGLPPATMPISNREWVLNQMIRTRTAIQQKSKTVLPVVETASLASVLPDQFDPLVAGWLTNRYLVQKDSWVLRAAQTLEKTFLVKPSWRVSKALHQAAAALEKRFCPPKRANLVNPKGVIAPEWKSTKHP